MAIFWHELGHALIGETRLPAAGPEEDVADGFAAFVLGNAAQEAGFSPSERAFMAGIVRYSTLLWHYLDLYAEDVPVAQRQLAEHASERERLRNSFCFIYGSDPAGYATAADALNVSARTRVRCEAEYANRNRAWETLLATVSHGQAKGSGRILLDLRPSDSPVGATVRRLLTSTGVMDRMMQRMERQIAWPRDLSVTFRDCPNQNAWYDPDRARITVCYGLIEQFSTTVFEAERTGGGLSARPARSRRP